MVAVYLTVVCVSLYLRVFVVLLYPTVFCVVFIYLSFCGTSLPGSCLCCVSLYMNVLWYQFTWQLFVLCFTLHECFCGTSFPDSCLWCVLSL